MLLFIICHFLIIHFLIAETSSWDPQKPDFQTRTEFSTASSFTVHSCQAWSSTDPRQKECEDHLINFVAEDLQALSVVKSHSFRLFTEKLNPSFNMPCRKTLSNKLIPKKKADMQSSIISNLGNTQQVCVTMDIWTNRDMRSYIGMTCHYIEKYQLKSAMLACSRFRGRHTAESISEKYDDILTSLSCVEK